MRRKCSKENSELCSSCSSASSCRSSARFSCLLILGGENFKSALRGGSALSGAALASSHQILCCRPGGPRPPLPGFARHRPSLPWSSTSSGSPPGCPRGSSWTPRSPWRASNDTWERSPHRSKLCEQLGRTWHPPPTWVNKLASTAHTVSRSTRRQSKRWALNVAGRNPTFGEKRVCATSAAVCVHTTSCTRLLIVYRF